MKSRILPYLNHNISCVVFIFWSVSTNGNIVRIDRDINKHSEQKHLQFLCTHNTYVVGTLQFGDKLHICLWNMTLWRANNTQSAAQKTVVASECKASCFLVFVFLSVAHSFLQIHRVLSMWYLIKLTLGNSRSHFHFYRSCDCIIPNDQI